MEEKGLFIVILLAIGVLGVIAYFGLQSHKNLGPAPAKQTTAEEKAAADTTDPSLAGRTYYERGDYAKALDAFKKALAENPGNQRLKDCTAGTDAMLRIQNAMTNKKWDEALAACQDAARYPLTTMAAKRRSNEINELKNYYENYDRGNQAAEQKDYAKASQAFGEAARVAQRLGISSDASQKADQMKSLAAKAVAAAADVDWVMQMCADRNDPYAVYAAANYYLSSDEYAVRHQDLKAKLELAKTSVTNHRDKYPELRNSATLRFDVVKMRNGEVIKGQILEKNEKLIKVREEKEGKARTRTLIAQTVADIHEEVVKPEDANNQRASELLAQALKEMESKHPIKALSIVGQLECELPDVSLMKDVPAQQKILSSASVATALKGGANLQSFAAACVERCQSVCAKCEGAARLSCPTCKGQKQTEMQCPTCMGTGKMTCTACNGSGKIFGTGSGRCPNCSGKGSLKCPTCEGKKFIYQPCTACVEGMIPCDACFGTGKRPTPRK
jgi:tetratricopeptide (TPR) repeat protein